MATRLTLTLLLILLTAVIAAGLPALLLAKPSSAEAELGVTAPLHPTQRPARRSGAGGDPSGG